MFTRHWRRNSLRDEGGGNPLHTLPSRMFHKNTGSGFRSADWGSDGNNWMLTWWWLLNVSLREAGSTPVFKHNRQHLLFKLTSVSISFYITMHGRDNDYYKIVGHWRHRSALLKMSYIIIFITEHGWNSTECSAVNTVHLTRFFSPLLLRGHKVTLQAKVSYWCFWD